MDIIAFLTRRGQISLQAMLCAFSYLSEAQRMKGFIEYDEIHQGLLLGADLSGAEVDVHSSIIYEATVVPVTFADRTRKMKFQIDGEGVASFIKNIMRTLQRKTMGKFSHSLDNFKRDCNIHFSHADAASLTMPAALVHRTPQDGTPKFGMTNIVYPTNKYASSLPYGGSMGSEMDSGMSKDIFETCEQGIRFLAEIRRGGMDILFPQVKHDKVLCIIFAVFTLVKSTAHKELIDLVMAVKECGTVSNLENVSKTKVRGVIALLKLAAIIETHGGTTEKAPVNLTLSLTVDSYETLREQHDEFISNFGATQPIVWRDEIYWGKLVWGRVNDTRRQEKLTEIEAIMPNLLDSAPLRPIVNLAGPDKIGEIFMTKEAALDHGKLYNAFTFKFDGDNDKESASETKKYAPISPLIQAPCPPVPPAKISLPPSIPKERASMVSILPGSTGPGAFLFDLDMLQATSNKIPTHPNIPAKVQGLYASPTQTDKMPPFNPIPDFPDRDLFRANSFHTYQQPHQHQHQQFLSHDRNILGPMSLPDMGSFLQDDHMGIPRRHSLGGDPNLDTGFLSQAVPNKNSFREHLSSDDWKKPLQYPSYNEGEMRNILPYERQPQVLGESSPLRRYTHPVMGRDNSEALRVARVPSSMWNEEGSHEYDNFRRESCNSFLFPTPAPHDSFMPFQEHTHHPLSHHTQHAQHTQQQPSPWQQQRIPDRLPLPRPIAQPLPSSASPSFQTRIGPPSGVGLGLGGGAGAIIGGRPGPGPGPGLGPGVGVGPITGMGPFCYTDMRSSSPSSVDSYYSQNDTKYQQQQQQQQRLTSPQSPNMLLSSLNFDAMDEALLKNHYQLPPHHFLNQHHR